MTTKSDFIQYILFKIVLKNDSKIDVNQSNIKERDAYLQIIKVNWNEWHRLPCETEITTTRRKYNPYW